MSFPAVSEPAGDVSNLVPLRRSLEYQQGYWNGFMGEPKTMTTERYLIGYADGMADSLLTD